LNILHSQAGRDIKGLMAVLSGMALCVLHKTVQDWPSSGQVFDAGRVTRQLGLVSHCRLQCRDDVRAGAEFQPSRGLGFAVDARLQQGAAGGSGATGGQAGVMDGPDPVRCRIDVDKVLVGKLP
jgi:hypothetical protein